MRFSYASPLNIVKFHALQDLVITAKVFNEVMDSISEVTLTHTTDGMYLNNEVSIPRGTKIVYVLYTIYENDGVTPVADGQSVDIFYHDKRPVYCDRLVAKIKGSTVFSDKRLQIVQGQTRAIRFYVYTENESEAYDLSMASEISVTFPGGSVLSLSSGDIEILQAKGHFELVMTSVFTQSIPVDEDMDFDLKIEEPTGDVHIVKFRRVMDVHERIA